MDRDIDCHSDPEIARPFARVTVLSASRADPPKLRVPSLILQCSQDTIAPDAVGEYSYKNLADSYLVKLQAIGHCANVSAREETLAAIRSDLAAAVAA